MLTNQVCTGAAEQQLCRRVAFDDEVVLDQQDGIVGAFDHLSVFADRGLRGGALHRHILVAGQQLHLPGDVQQTPGHQHLTHPALSVGQGHLQHLRLACLALCQALVDQAVHQTGMHQGIQPGGRGGKHVVPGTIASPMHAPASSPHSGPI